jgi:hypothetical protein
VAKDLGNKSMTQELWCFLQLHPANFQFVDAHFWCCCINSIDRAERTSTRVQGPVFSTLERRNYGYKLHKFKREIFNCFTNLHVTRKNKAATECGPEDMYRCFWGTWCLRHQLWWWWRTYISLNSRYVTTHALHDLYNYQHHQNIKSRNIILGKLLILSWKTRLFCQIYCQRQIIYVVVQSSTLSAAICGKLYMVRNNRTVTSKLDINQSNYSVVHVNYLWKVQIMGRVHRI